MLHVAAIPIGPAGQGLEAMLREAEAAIEAAAERGAQLVVLPELFALPYIASDEPHRWRHLAEPMDGVTCRAMATVAQRLEIGVLFGLALSEGTGKPLNAALLAAPDGTVRRIAEKINLPPADAGRFGEADHFRPGRPGFPPVELGGAKVSAMICFDRRYPESWRARMEAGTDLVAVLVAGPAPGDPPGIYEAELRCHARANAMFVAAAARHGTETLLDPAVTHDGGTLTIDADGAVVACAEARPGGNAFLAIDDNALDRARVARMQRVAGRFSYEIPTERRAPCAN